mmetsp:Transcript_94333/g.148408  ORF Transcript_94333/g.148408 Transcript_94333/m.148408 type:complete len:222 (-) Transcript_94333:2-667(-)
MAARSMARKPGPYSLSEPLLWRRSAWTSSAQSATRHEHPPSPRSAEKAGSAAVFPWAEALCRETMQLCRWMTANFAPAMCWHSIASTGTGTTSSFCNSPTALTISSSLSCASSSLLFGGDDLHELHARDSCPLLSAWVATARACEPLWSRWSKTRCLNRPSLAQTHLGSHLVEQYMTMASMISILIAFLSSSCLTAGKANYTKVNAGSYSQNEALCNKNKS